MATSLESVPGMGLLVIHLIQIRFIIVAFLVVYSVLGAMIDNSVGRSEFWPIKIYCPLDLSNMLSKISP